MHEQLEAARAGSALNHQSAKKFLPTGGWGDDSISVPRRRVSGRNQPGSWAYSIMFYMEAQAWIQQTAGLPIAGPNGKVGGSRPGAGSRRAHDPRTGGQKLASDPTNVLLSQSATGRSVWRYGPQQRRRDLGCAQERPVYEPDLDRQDRLCGQRRQRGIQRNGEPARP